MEGEPVCLSTAIKIILAVTMVVFTMPRKMSSDFFCSCNLISVYCQPQTTTNYCNSIMMANSGLISLLGKLPGLLVNTIMYDIHSLWGSNKGRDLFILLRVSLGPFHGAIAVPSVTRYCCRRRCSGHRCVGGARHLVNGHEAARSGEWAQHFSNVSCLQ